MGYGPLPSPCGSVSLPPHEFRQTTPKNDAGLRILRIEAFFSVMALRTGGPESPFALGATAVRELERRVESAHERGGVAAVTVPVPADLDVSAAVLAARRPDDRFFCLEQPERDSFALAALGTAALLQARGPARFTELARAQRELASRTVAGDAGGGDPVGSGPVLVGGFAFAPEGGRSPEWSSLAPAQLVMPEVALVRRGGEARLTVCVAADGNRPVERALARLAELAPAAMPMLDPDPLERARVAGAAPPAHYEAAVERAVERIRAGELEKVVLAREVRVHAGQDLDPAPVLDALRGVFPACCCYCVGTPEAAFVGASPELLARREGARAQTVALAGTTRRSADPAVDDHLGEQLMLSPKDREEQAIVARRIQRTLDPMSL